MRNLLSSLCIVVASTLWQSTAAFVIPTAGGLHRQLTVSSSRLEPDNNLNYFQNPTDPIRKSQQDDSIASAIKTIGPTKTTNNVSDSKNGKAATSKNGTKQKHANMPKEDDTAKSSPRNVTAASTKPLADNKSNLDAPMAPKKTIQKKVVIQHDEPEPVVNDDDDDKNQSSSSSSLSKSLFKEVEEQHQSVQLEMESNQQEPLEIIAEVDDDKEAAHWKIEETFNEETVQPDKQQKTLSSFDTDIIQEEPITTKAKDKPEHEVLQPDKQPEPILSYLPSVTDDQQATDERFMAMAIKLAQQSGTDVFPKPNVGAVLVASDGRTVLGQGASNYQTSAVVNCLTSAGLQCTPLAEWSVTYYSASSEAALRDELTQSTLYVTLEPSKERHGTALPPLTRLIQRAGIERIVIGCPDPVASRATAGASALHEAGLSVSLGSCLLQECQDLIQDYSTLMNSKLHRMSRQHFRQFGRPLGFLHCSVIESNNIEAFQRHGNAFGTNFGDQRLGYRDFGSYEIAPPPEVIWAQDDTDQEYFFDLDDDDDDGEILSVEFDDEEVSADIMPIGSPMMPWYEQVDAVVGTFPRQGNGPPDDDSLLARLNGLKWLATHGNELPKNVERILVMDATDLPDLPLDNSSTLLPSDVDVEAFWKATGRRRTRLLLRRGENERARAAAVAAAAAAQAAAVAAKAAADAIESGDAARAAQAARDCEKAALAELDIVQSELEKTQRIKSQLENMGVLVETLEGGEPVDVMNYLGKRNGYHTVVWRAGCWGNRGVQAVLAGAFQWVSAHLAVDAVGGRFWQLLLAENCVQAALGPQQRIKVFAEQGDLSLEYCDQPGVDDDCSMTFEGRPVRHVRLDCRVALVDQSRPREFVLDKTKPIDRKFVEEQAPWFL